MASHLSIRLSVSAFSAERRASSLVAPPEVQSDVRREAENDEGFQGHERRSPRPSRSPRTRLDSTIMKYGLVRRRRRKSRSGYSREFRESILYESCLSTEFFNLFFYVSSKQSTVGGGGGGGLGGVNKKKKGKTKEKKENKKLDLLFRVRPRRCVRVKMFSDPSGVFIARASREFSPRMIQFGFHNFSRHLNNRFHYYSPPPPSTHRVALHSPRRVTLFSNFRHG